MKTSPPFLSRHRFAAIALISCASVAAGETPAKPESLTSVPQSTESHTFGTWGVDLAYRDLGIRPGDNFYEYVNGKWLAQVPFAPNEKAQAFWRYVRLLAPLRLNGILESLAADTAASATSPEGKAGAFYRSFMDEKTIEAMGLSPLNPQLEAIRAVKSKSQLASLMGQIAGPGTIRARIMFGQTPGWAFFRLDDINQDLVHPERYAVYLGAGGLVLPGPEYYLETQFAALRKAYVAYIARVLTLVGWPVARERAQQVLDLETEIARVSWSHEQMLDSVKTYNPMTIRDLAKFAPEFDWRAFMTGGQLAGVGTVVIDARSAFPKIAAIFAAAPLELLKARQAFGVADEGVYFLNSELGAAANEFYGNALGNGAFMGSAPRNIRAEKTSEMVLGDIVSGFYVARYSSPRVKAIAQEMAENMRQALDAHLQTLSWMGPASRARAREKLARMHILIGYPEHFDDFAGLEVKEHDLYGNYARSAAYQWQALVHRLGKPYDPSQWSVRAEYPTFSYTPTSNTVEIPAALLVPPFFDAAADPAVNYGSAGTIIGAMIASPFFMQQGLNFDTDGHLNPWLARDEAARFSAMSRRIADQYSRVEQIPGFPLKGELLADEALGDLAGLEISLDAYHASLRGSSAPQLDGYSGDQRFFLGRAFMWRAKFVESFVRSQIATGSNEPPFMRVNGLLPNMDSWYSAFDVKPGDGLYVAPEQRVKIW